MATIIAGRTGQRVYPEVVKRILKEGTPRVVRGLQTYDLGYTVIELESAQQALPLGTGRDLSRNIAAAEAIQLVGGFSYTDLLTKAVPSMIDYTDDGKFYGSYGNRIGYQILHVARKLSGDPGTRQAVITLWDPWLDNVEGKHDYPCTVMLQFERDGDILHMNTVMRSNDAWLGLPYDLFQFTQLQLTLANSLKLATGRYRHTALSLHLYQKDLAKAEKVGEPTDFTIQPVGLGVLGQSMTEIMKRARSLTVLNTPNVDETHSERWYRERFASYMG